MESLCPLIIGICYLVLAVTLFVANAVLFAVVMSHKEFKTTTFRIIKSICVACMMQLFALAVGGMMTIAQTNFDYYLDKVLGVIIESGWCLYVALSLTLAVDRLLIFTGPRTRFYSVVTTLLLSLSWLIWLFLVVLLSLPGFGVSYGDGETYYFWEYNEEEGSQILANVDPFYDLAMFTATFVIYLILFGYLLKLKRSSAAESGLFKAEMRIFVVAVVSFSNEVVYEVFGYFAEVSDHAYVDVVLNVAWLIECGLFAVAVRPKEYKTNTFRIIRSISASCMIQLFVLAVGGIMTMVQSTFDHHVDKILGMIIQSGSYPYVLLTLALAVVRRLIFASQSYNKSIAITVGLLFVSWIFWLAVFLLLCLPGFGVTYGGNNNLYYWDYDDQLGSQALGRDDTYFVIIVFSLSFIICSVIIGHLF
ncbi:hypothetical protein QR680_003698 [Steinernema hermaphroditum]|uniref:Uncharacterized protein n=1 Tax=Steinernema hermaphroditum TaxID=289476 RepID=A0AA39HM90_9BILA|nr:hypothetical protein QR680_003698 [Steinernema hermaphroditum]